MAYPKGRPRGPQSEDHKRKLGAAISLGQKKRFESQEARKQASDAAYRTWHSGVRSGQFVDSRAHRMSISLEAPDWSYVQWMARAQGEPVVVILRRIIAASRKQFEDTLVSEGFGAA